MAANDKSDLRGINHLALIRWERKLDHYWMNKGLKHLGNWPRCLAHAVAGAHIEQTIDRNG